MVQTIPASIVNEVITCKKNVLEPKVGMLGTYFVGSDRYAVVICKVYTSKKIFVQYLYGGVSKKVVDGVEYWAGDVNDLVSKNSPKFNPAFGEDAALMFAYDTADFWKEGTYTLRKNGRWVNQGEGQWSPGSIHLGVADPYRDPNF